MGEGASEMSEDSCERGPGSCGVSPGPDELEETGQKTALTRRGLMVIPDS